MWDTGVYLAQAIKALNQMEEGEKPIEDDRESMSVCFDSRVHVKEFLKNKDWKILFELGCMIPHAVVHSEKNSAQWSLINEKVHFQYGYWIRSQEKVFMNSFLRKYRPCIYRPLELGYYFHLLMDQKGRDEFIEKNYTSCLFNGKPGRNAKNKLLQYIPGFEYKMRNVFFEQKISAQIAEEMCNESEVLKELENLESWLSNERNFFDCTIQEVKGYSLKKLLLKEIEQCKNKISQLMKRTNEQLDSEFEKNLKKDIQCFQKDTVLNFTNSMLYHTDNCGWLVVDGWHGVYIKGWGNELREFLGKRGILGIILLILTQFIKFIKVLLCGNKQRRGDKQKESCQEIIYEKWKEQWTCGEARVTDRNKDFFYRMFVENYEFVTKKIDLNRRKNLFYKQLFLIPLIAIVATAMVNSVLLLKEKSGDCFQILLIWSSAGGVFVLLSAIIAKWLDIKKYQETWVRHSNHKYKLDRELFLYIYQLKPYAACSAYDRRKIFITNVLEIWDSNQKKFTENMENKEKPMADALSYVKNGSE